MEDEHSGLIRGDGGVKQVIALEKTQWRQMMSGQIQKDVVGV